MNKFDSSPLGLIKSVVKNRSVIWELTKREVASRYKGSALGMVWSVINPILLMLVYTFVFSVVFKAKWGGEGDSKSEFALILFAGLIPFNVISESLNRAPYIIISNINYVKKVIFPLEVLPVVVLLGAIFHAIVNTVVWFAVYILLVGLPPASFWQMSIVFIPVILYSLGGAWFLSSLGAYLRDIGQLIGSLTTVLMFLTPIFYSIKSLPPAFQTLLSINPLTSIVEWSRDVMIWGLPISTEGILLQIVLSVGCACLGFMWFQKTRKGFADVL